MDDWDPFADPGDAPSEPAKLEVVKASPPDPKRRVESDILAALRSSEIAEVALEVDPHQVQQELDALFGMDDNSPLLQKEFAGLAGKCHGHHFMPMWRRAAPLLEAEACNNLLGLMIDDCLSLSADPNTNSKNVVLVEEGDSGEVVFLLAWGGGNAAELRDLMEFYRELMPGCTIFLSTSNLKQSFGLRLQCATGIRAAAKAWSSAASAEPKLLVHLFSNSGAHAWAELLQSWEKLQSCEEELLELGLSRVPPLQQVLRGIILDSAPDGDVSADACIQSLVQSVAALVSVALASDHDGSEADRKEAETRSRRAVSATIGGTSVVTSYLKSKPAKSLTRMAKAETAVLHALEPPVPMQFIYSKDDNIILAQGVERYLEEVNARPNRKGLALPRVWCIEKSRHCMHKLTRPEEYRKVVKLFTSSVMEAR